MEEYYDYLDIICASALNVDVETFINKIESTTEYRMNTIITTLLESEDEYKLQQARRCFNMIK